MRPGAVAKGMHTGWHGSRKSWAWQLDIAYGFVLFYFILSYLARHERIVGGEDESKDTIHVCHLGLCIPRKIDRCPKRLRWQKMTLELRQKQIHFARLAWSCGLPPERWKQQVASVLETGIYEGNSPLAWWSSFVTSPYQYTHFSSPPRIGSSFLSYRGHLLLTPIPSCQNSWVLHSALCQLNENFLKQCQAWILWGPTRCASVFPGLLQLGPDVLVLL